MGVLTKRLVTRYGLITSMLLPTLGLGLFLYQTMQQKQLSHFSEHQSTLDTAYRASIQMYHLAIENFYANTIDRSETKLLLETAVNTEGRPRDMARGRLYRQLFPAYQAIKADIPLQLQFYLPDGTSFLRFHKPDRYGDPLLGFQDSVRLATEEKRPVHGFETGKVRSGFRYVYPLFQGERHLGSIGVSVTAKGIRDALAKLDPNREYAFLLNLNLSQPHIFPEQQWLYSSADIHPDYLIEDANAILPDSPPSLSDGATVINRQLRNDPRVQKAMSQGVPLTTHASVNGAPHIVSLLPIQDVGGQTAGYLISYAPDPVYAAIINEFIIYLMTILIVSAVITLLILRIRRWTIALSTEERNLQAMNNALAEGVYVTDSKGNIERINPAACKILGFSEQDLLGKTAHDLFHCHSDNAFLPKDECPFFNALSQGQPYQGEERFRHRSGSILIVGLASRPIWGEGKLIGAVTAFHDITARKATEKRLKQSEELSRKLSTAVEQSPTAIIITDLDGIIEYANPQFLQMTGYKESGVIGQSSRLLKAGYMPHGFYKDLWRTISAGRTWKGEILNRRKNGDLYWELNAISPIRNSDNCITHYIATKVDISERKRMEETLRENEEIQRTLMEGLPIPLVIIDAVTRIIESVNPAAAQLIGATEDKIVGNRCHSVLCPAQENNCPILDLKQTVDSSEKLLIQHDGFQIPVLKTVRKITIKGREKLIECMMDIRDRLEAERSLRIANRQWEEATAKAEQLAEAADAANLAKSTFLASMSHEIRTPLNAILGYSQLLQKDSELKPHHREQIQTINRSGDHLLELINDILEISRIEAGHVTLHPVPLDFRQLMADLASMFKLSCQQKDLWFDMTLGQELPRYLNADRAKIRQVLINLLSNAVKFTDHGHISLRASASTTDKLHWLIAVDIIDSGGGIDPSEQDKLFEAFEQTSSGRTTGLGSGLGLSISRAYAEQLGGELRLAESVAGSGSRFRFTFTAQQCAGDELQLAPSSNRCQVSSIAPQYLPIRALVVEDDPNSRNMLCETLNEIGFSVEAVTSGEEAIEHVSKWEPDLVLMDVQMAGMDGYQATRQLRSLPNSPQMKIIIVTAGGLASSDLSKQTLEAGADDYIAKPFKTTDLYTKLKALCGFDYLYGPAPIDPKSTGEIRTNPETVRTLPDSLLAALKQAVEQGDMVHFAELLNEVGARNRALQESLSALADRYEYEKLLALLG
jgi:PAS domain S-box-containing protein